jgi:hypothetical protein
MNGWLIQHDKRKNEYIIEDGAGMARDKIDVDLQS